MAEPSTRESPSVVVLRWGHRERDKRLTAHVALTARALGTSGLILADVRDDKVKDTIDKVVERWGGTFLFEMGKPWKQTVKDWKAKGGLVVHLTAYGENVETGDVLQRIKAAGKNVLVLVGSRKVPTEFFSEEELLINHGVYPPPVVTFFNLLKKEGYYKGVLPLTVEQAHKELGKFLRRKSL